MTEKELAITVTDRDGMDHQVPALAGWRVMEIIRDNDLPIRAECGGSCACATCHVYVGAEWQNKMPPPSTDERYLLEAAPGFDPAVSRLSCQILMKEDLDGLTVTLVPGTEP